MRTDFVQADTVKLQYFEHGTGPECLVLVHGYLALPESRRFLHIFHSIGHSPNVEVATRCAGVLDRFVSQTVPQCLAAARSVT
jgi:hypothetical protein